MKKCMLITGAAGFIGSHLCKFYLDKNFFIIRAEETTTGSLMSSIKKIKSVGAKIDGIILNDVDTSKGSYGYYNYYQKMNIYHLH